MAVSARAGRRQGVGAPSSDRLEDLLAGATAEPHFQMAHRVVLPVDLSRAFAVTDAARLDRFLTIRLLFWLRGLDRPGTTRQSMNALGFPTRRDEPGRILSFLGAGRLCSRHRLFDPLGPSELAKAAESRAPRRSIAIWAAYEFRPLAPGRTLLTQTTRVRCGDRTAWLLFGGYWIATRPCLDLIRVILLRSIRRECRRDGSAASPG